MAAHTEEKEKKKPNDMGLLEKEKPLRRDDLQE